MAYDLQLSKGRALVRIVACSVFLTGNYHCQGVTVYMLPRTRVVARLHAMFARGCLRLTRHAFESHISMQGPMGPLQGAAKQARATKPSRLADALILGAGYESKRVPHLQLYVAAMWQCGDRNKVIDI